MWDRRLARLFWSTRRRARRPSHTSGYRSQPLEGELLGVPGPRALQATPLQRRSVLARGCCEIGFPFVLDIEDGINV
jgi:hypothetical protein